MSKETNERIAHIELNAQTNIAVAHGKQVGLMDLFEYNPVTSHLPFIENYTQIISMCPLLMTEEMEKDWNKDVKPDPYF